MEVSNYILIKDAKLSCFSTYLIILVILIFFSIVMDKTTESGYQPKYVAECILKSVLKQKKEIIIAPLVPKCAIILRTLFPSLYFWIMQKRARKLAREK